jgi:uncharacterized protein (DUF885 family)
MMRFLLCLALAGCNGAAPPPGSGPASVAPPREQLLRLVERYWDERLPEDLDIAPQFLADSLAVERRFLVEIAAIPREPLDEESRLTYDIFKAQREMRIEGFTYPSELLPVNPFSGEPLELAATAALIGRRPLTTAAQYEDWLRQIERDVRWAQQAIVNLRDGMRRGYTVPRALILRMLPILQSLGADERDNVFRLALRSMPAGIKDGSRAELFKRLEDATQRLLSANRALHDFLQTDYLPHARSGLGLSELPLGGSWYAYRIRRATGSHLTATDIHRLGLAEVERLRARIAPLRAAAAAPVPGAPPAAPQGMTGSSTGSPGGLASGAPPDTSTGSPNGSPTGVPLDMYAQAGAQIAMLLPALFAAAPGDDLVFAAGGFLRDPGSSLVYRAGRTAGHVPGIIFVAPETGRSAVVMADFLQTAVPGRHYQDAIAQGRLDLPRFRRYDAEPAFVAGWGLYAASLGEELGVYADDAAKLAAGLAQMRCAAALVVDTGLHAFDWTRAQALDYLHAQAGIQDPEAQQLVDGYAAMPGDALACKIGELGIQALRTRAQQQLGERFDVRQFHAAILNGGAMPLGLLESRIKRWIEAVP